MLGFLEMRSGWCFRAKHVKDVANTLADGISRWERENVNRHLREYHPDINWQQDLGLTGRDLHIGVQYIRGSVAEAFECTFVSSFRSWIKFRGLTSTAWDFSDDTPVGDMVWVLVTAWCCAAEGNKVGTIKSKIAAVQYFHRVEVGMELLTKSRLERVFCGMSRAHAVAGTKARVRRSMSWDKLLEGEKLLLSRGRGGRILWLRLPQLFDTKFVQKLSFSIEMKFGGDSAEETRRRSM